MQVVGERDTVLLTYVNVVAMSEIQKQFSDKWELRFGIGYTITKSNKTPN